MTKNKLLQVQVLNLFIALLVCIVSLVIASFYIGGDQAHYNDFYSIAQVINLNEITIVQPVLLDSREYIYGLIVWCFANLQISHVIFVSLFNAIFAYFILKLFQRWKVHILVSVLFIFTNFYMIVLYFSAERLKFALLFFVLLLLNLKKSKKTILYFSLSIMSHIQVIILYGALFFAIDKEKNFLMKKWKLFLFVLLVITLFFVMFDQIYSKFNAYNGTYGILEFYKSIIFLLLSLWYSKKKYTTFMIFMPLFVAIFFVGDIRINMFSYFIFLYYALHVNNGLNFGILLTTIYYAYKSLFFVYNIINYGDGFYNAL